MISVWWQISPRGFEPRLPVPKTEVLPLHHGPNSVRNLIESMSVSIPRFTKELKDFGQFSLLNSFDMHSSGSTFSRMKNPKKWQAFIACCPLPAESCCSPTTAYVRLGILLFQSQRQDSNLRCGCCHLDYKSSPFDHSGTLAIYLQTDALVH